MQFLNAIKYGFKNYFNFGGVVDRSTFWYWILFAAVLEGLAFAIVLPEDGDGTFFGFSQPDNLLVNLVLISPTLAMMIRRLRDAGRSPGWVALIVLPYLFGIIGGIIGWFTPTHSEGFMVIFDVFSQLATSLLFATIGASIGIALAGPPLIIMFAQPTRK